jgi:hypothetical protein
LISLCFVPLLLSAAREVRSLGWRSWVAVAMIAVGPQALATVLFTEALMYVFPAKSVPNLNVQVEIYLLYLLQPVFALAFARLLLRERRRPYFWPLALVAVTKVVLGPAGRAAQGAGRSAPAWCRGGGVGHHVLQHPHLSAQSDTARAEGGGSRLSCVGPIAWRTSDTPRRGRRRRSAHVDRSQVAR